MVYEPFWKVKKRKIMIFHDFRQVTDPPKATLTQPWSPLIGLVVLGVPPRWPIWTPGMPGGFLGITDTSHHLPPALTSAHQLPPVRTPADTTRLEATAFG